MSMILLKSPKQLHLTLFQTQTASVSSRAWRVAAGDYQHYVAFMVHKEREGGEGKLADKRTNNKADKELLAWVGSNLPLAR